MSVSRALDFLGKSFLLLASLGRFRAARAVLWAILAIYVFDRAVYFATETQWFASLGLGALWWERCRAQCALFFGFALISLLLARVFLRPATSISAGEAPLPGALSRLETLRFRVSQFAWLLVLAAILVLSRNLARNWSEFLFWRGGASDGYYLGLPIFIWTHFLPVFEPFLRSLWAFSLFLFVVVAATGILRALPLLAARAPSSPLVLTRTLWRFGAWLLVLRAVLYIVQILDLSRGRALQSGDLFVSAPLFLLGCLACAILSFVALRRAKGNAPRHKATKWVFTMLAALFVPGIINWLSIPERALLPETAWLQKQRVAATKYAWKLDFDEAKTPACSLPIEKAWPVWDEKTLLEYLSAMPRSAEKIVKWESAHLRYDGQKWVGLAAAQKVGAASLMTGREADDDNALSLEKLDFAPDGSVKQTPLEKSNAFFGFAGTSLFSSGNFGVPIRSWGQKYLWAWRLRDVFLPSDAANSSRLLIWRNAHERAQKIVPFWAASAGPQLELEGGNPVWRLDLIAANRNYPGAMSAPIRGAEANGFWETISMRLDARSGAVTFEALPARKNGRSQPWHTALPLKWRAEKQRSIAPEVLRAQLALTLQLRNPNATAPEIFGPQSGFDLQNGRVSRVFAIQNREISILESANSGLILRRGSFDWDARLEAIDAAKTKITPRDATIEVGEPVLWSDKRAPGGFWIGRTFFGKSRGNSPLGAQKTLWRVALTGASSGAKIGFGTDARSAFLNFSGRSVSTLPQNQFSLATQALRAHDAAMRAAKNGNWPVFARESARQRRLLEQIAARRGP